MNDEQLLRYSRHVLLDDIGVEGQERIGAAHATVVGAGGLGSPAAMYLASAGVGRLTIADDDVVDLTNLQRQILHTTPRVGRPKVESARVALNALNPEVEIVGLHERLADEALDRVVASSTVVLDCSDNFATRHAINRACVRHRVPLVSGAAIGFDGQLAVYDARDASSPCYACLFAPDQAVEEVRCATMGVFAPLTGIIGTLQAAEALKLIARLGTSSIGRLIMFDTRRLDWRTIRFDKDPDCSVCGALTNAAPLDAATS